MKVPRISNPETFVDVIYTDCGDVRPIYDKNGKVYEGFTSKFEFNGKTVKSYVSRQEALESRNPNQFRFMEDAKVLRKYDLNLEGVILDD